MISHLPSLCISEWICRYPYAFQKGNCLSVESCWKGGVQRSKWLEFNVWISKQRTYWDPQFSTVNATTWSKTRKGQFVSSGLEGPQWKLGFLENSFWDSDVPGRRFTEEYSQQHHIGGSEGSRAGQKEMLSWDGAQKLRWSFGDVFTKTSTSVVFIWNLRVTWEGAPYFHLGKLLKKGSEVSPRHAVPLDTCGVSVLGLRRESYRLSRPHWMEHLGKGLLSDRMLCKIFPVGRIL